MTSAAAAGREILIGVKGWTPASPPDHPLQIEAWRSTDDGATFAPLDVPEIVTSFAPGRYGWYLGTAFHGLQRLPFAP